MKMGRNYLIFAVLTAILCIAALGEVELPLPEDESILFGQPNPTLAGIDKLYVRIVPHRFEPNSHGLVIEELENSIIDGLKEAGITIAETDIDKAGPDAAKMLKVLKRRIKPANAKNLKFRPAHIPELCVNMDMLVLKHLQQAVFHIQISLARLVHLEKENRPSFKTDVWQSEPIMQAASVQDMPVVVSRLILKQVETFAAAWREANPPNKQISDANDIGVTSLTAPKEQAGSAAKPSVAEYSYVASKKSKVFHKPGCRWAKNISPGNLVRYVSREEAIKDGKKPCGTCKP